MQRTAKRYCSRLAIRAEMCERELARAIHISQHMKEMWRQHEGAERHTLLSGEGCGRFALHDPARAENCDANIVCRSDR